MGKSMAIFVFYEIDVDLDLQMGMILCGAVIFCEKYVARGLYILGLSSDTA